MLVIRLTHVSHTRQHSSDNSGKGYPCDITTATAARSAGRAFLRYMNSFW
jgi:hypothetical protein